MEVGRERAAEQLCFAIFQKNMFPFFDLFRSGPSWGPLLFGVFSFFVPQLGGVFGLFLRVSIDCRELCLPLSIELGNFGVFSPVLLFRIPGHLGFPRCFRCWSLRILLTKSNSSAGGSVP